MRARADVYNIGWQWLFALEGMLTGLIGILAWFYLPSSPYTTASWFRGKNGWFSEHEEKIIANRVIRDDPSKGDMHNREGLSLGMLWECLKDYHMVRFPVLGYARVADCNVSGPSISLD